MYKANIRATCKQPGSFPTLHQFLNEFKVIYKIQSELYNTNIV